VGDVYVASQHDALGGDERLDGVAQSLASDAGVADTAEGNVAEAVTRGAVDQNRTGVDRVRDPHRSVVIAGEHRRVETEVVVVRHRQRVGFRAHPRDGRDGTELLLGQEARVAWHVRQKRRLEPPAVALAARDESRPPVDGVRCEGLDPGGVVGRDDRPDGGVRVEQRPGLPLVEFGREAPDQVVVDCLVGEDATDGRTALPGVLERPFRAVTRRSGEVGVRGDDGRCVPPSSM